RAGPWWRRGARGPAGPRRVDRRGAPLPVLDAAAARGRAGRVEVLYLSDAVHRRPPAPRGAEPHGAHRLVGRSAVGARDAGDREREVDARDAQRPLGHLPHRLLAHGPEALERARRDAQIASLCGIGIGHVAALEPLRAPGHVGERLGDPACGARFRGDEAPPGRLELLADALGQHVELRIARHEARLTYPGGYR